MKKILNLNSAIAFIIFLLLSSCKAIFKGRQASVNQLPFIVSLRNNANHHIDSGTIISHHFVITSAWIVSHNPSALVAGSVRIDTGGTRYEIADKTVHPQYNNQTFENNLSLLRTRYKIGFTDSVKAISLNVYELGEKVPVFSAGWGTSEESTGLTSITLRWANFYTMDKDSCETELKAVKLEKFFNENLICVHGYENLGQAWCPYDNGGPLVSGMVLVGVVFRPGMTPCKGHDNFPHTAVKISRYLHWITEVIITHES